ncbi:archaeosortase A [Halobacterium salinarum]|uniref:archaeosortase A n=1 Tax=Halobacterium salinarum TaxID=2242 RepID=UPI002555471A|nr:archaeosortase A [Halobacterium salinarum]MDL0125811.1 archaeosortase A [Halobacterium salinarum]MDL0131875.1 archaeosortase A [Halobacterium salinarum]MDL0140543.1 archaeosortase A [Halobacterium salinarum]MDL0141052.1 archaeosortase A [Halobacterium salinarum]MDL0143509.1 archaeosortase A [Halobacterium salinarum]
MTAATDALAWVVVAAFATSALIDAASDDHEAVRRYAAVGAWAVFGLFWGLLIEHFLFVQQSLIEGALAAAAVPACLYTAYLVASGRKSLATLTRAIAVMGLLYIPFQTIEPLRRWAILTTTHHAAWIMGQLGYHPAIEVATSYHGYPAKFAFHGTNVVTGEPWGFPTTVLLACTGIGSMSIVGGLVAAVDAPMRRRLRALGVAIPLIYGMNLVRVVFIAIAHGNQWFGGDVIEGVVFALFPTDNPNRVSYLFADRVLAQSLSVVVLVVLTLALLRIVPELGGVIEDVAFVLTGNEYDITGRFAGDR